MQRLSLVVSLGSLSLMMGGFVVKLLSGGIILSLPGVSVLPLAMLVHPSPGAVSLDMMSTGIVLLALLPTARVVLALWLYLQRGEVLNILAALIVLLELLLSM
ncbi:MAG: DUF1634 domain-containing protein [Anaerolineae bacterium]|nr:DUF1634 domain-containing protein [Anaerolineae bacterium]